MLIIETRPHFESEHGGQLLATVANPGPEEGAFYRTLWGVRLP